jgi:hypothetical protein
MNENIEKSFLVTAAMRIEQTVHLTAAFFAPNPCHMDVSFFQKQLKLMRRYARNLGGAQPFMSNVETGSGFRWKGGRRFRLWSKRSVTSDTK